MGILVGLLVLFFAQNGAVAAPGPPRFEAAHFGHSSVTVFPDAGKEITIQLPPNVPATANLIGFALSGRSAYLQDPAAAMVHLPDDLIEMDFSPPRLALVPGSDGLGDISSVTNSSSGNLFVAARGGRRLSGAYEIDISQGTHRPIFTESAPKYLLGVAQVEPDGKRALVADFSSFKVVNVLTGAIELSGVGRGAWSPDGNWLAISKKGEITTFDGRTFSVRKRFRASSVDGHLVWSPDSKRILFVQQEHRCFLQDDYESLAVLDIETEKKWVIPSSHCAVTNSQVGWIDIGALPPSGGKK